MEQPPIHVEEKSHRLLRGTPMMVVALFFVLIVVPMVFVMSGQAASLLQSAGIRLNPNMDDGRVIAEFEDASADLLREIPHGTSFEDASHALDIRRFSVKKVAFRPFSGMGIEPRLNLVFTIFASGSVEKVGDLHRSMVLIDEGRYLLGNAVFGREGYALLHMVPNH